MDQPTTSMKVDFTFDEKTKNTVIWSAIFYAGKTAIERLAAIFGMKFMGGAAGQISKMADQFSAAFGVQSPSSVFPWNSLIQDVLWGAVTGAIIGFVLSKFYIKIYESFNQYSKGKIDSLFKLLFYPVILASLITFILGGALSFVTGILPVIIQGVGILVGGYLYAKLTSDKVGMYFNNIQMPMQAPTPTPAPAPASATPTIQPQQQPQPEQPVQTPTSAPTQPEQPVQTPTSAPTQPEQPQQTPPPTAQ